MFSSTYINAKPCVVIIMAQLETRIMSCWASYGPIGLGQRALVLKGGRCLVGLFLYTFTTSLILPKGYPLVL